MPSVIRARVFRSGNSQAVRLPKQFRFRSPMVEIYRRGEEMILRERKATLAEAFDLLAGLSRDFFAGGRRDDPPSKKRAGTIGVATMRGQKEKAVATVTVRIPESLLKRAQATTGRRDAEAAVRRALVQSRREEREGKVRRFSTARDAVAYLKRS